MNIEARFYEWFEKEYGKPEEQTVFYRVALKAYKQGLLDYPDTDIDALSQLEFNRPIANPTMAEAVASAALVEFFEPKPKKPRRDLTLYPHCSKHPRYHGLKYPQARKEGWTGFQTCAECQEVYEEVQKVKKAAKEPGRVALP